MAKKKNPSKKQKYNRAGLQLGTSHTGYSIGGRRCSDQIRPKFYVYAKFTQHPNSQNVELAALYINLVENLPKYLKKTSLHRCSSSNLPELDLFCNDEFAKNILASRCAKLVEPFHKSLSAGCVSSGKSENKWIQDFFHFFCVSSLSKLTILKMHRLLWVHTFAACCTCSIRELWIYLLQTGAICYTFHKDLVE